MNTRIEWIDYAKAIGIVLVVYGHVARGLFNAGIDIPLGMYALADSIVYSFHMPLFFFLSGLFFYDSFSKKGGGRLLLSKVDTIVYPYLLWSLAQGAIEVYLSNYTNGTVTVSQVISLWEPRGQFWFLYALFALFVICAAFYSVIAEKFGIAILIFAALLYLANPFFPHFFLVHYVCGNLVFFVFGIVFVKYRCYEPVSSRSGLLITAILFILAQYYFHQILGELYESTDRGIDTLLLASISITFVVSLAAALSRRPNKFIAYVGVSSMAIYLMHILAGSGVRIILSEMLGVDSALIHLIAGCSLGLLLPLLALKIIDVLKIPFVFSAPISKWLGVYNKQ